MKYSICSEPLLTPIPVGGPFNGVGVDVLLVQKTKYSNKYAIVFI